MAEVRGINVSVEGLEELQAQFGRIGRIPKKYLTKAARAGMDAVLRDAKASAPTGKTGILKKSIKKKMETPNKRNKGVYRLVYDAKFTDDFLKPSSGIYGGKPPVAYYPASVEYGFKTKTGKVAGQFNMMKAVQRHETEAIHKVIESLNESINELLATR